MSLPISNVPPQLAIFCVFSGGFHALVAEPCSADKLYNILVPAQMLQFYL